MYVPIYYKLTNTFHNGIYEFDMFNIIVERLNFYRWFIKCLFWGLTSYFYLVNTIITFSIFRIKNFAEQNMLIFLGSQGEPPDIYTVSNRKRSNLYIVHKMTSDINSIKIVSK